MDIIPYGKHHITEDDIENVVAVLKSGSLTCGPKIREFEEKFRSYVGMPSYALAVCNGTAALHLAAKSLGVCDGDNVIVSTITFAASANCIRFCGGNVTFCDIDPETYLMDIAKLRRILESSPKGSYKGIVVVDFAGYPHNMEIVRSVADEYGLWIIEDACHAPGAYFTDSKGSVQLTGNSRYADATVFSFHPVKHITSGEGGMMVTNREDIHRKASLLRTHGVTKRVEDMEKYDGGWYYEMVELGYNYRITDIQAALAISQLSRAKENVETRREIARRYDEIFGKHERIKTPYVSKLVGHAYHLYLIQVDDRKGLYDYLRKNGVYSQVLYYPLHLMPYYKALGCKEGDCPVAEEYYKHCLALPMYPTLTRQEQDYVIEKVLEYVEN